MSQKLVAARGGRSYKGTRSCHRHTWNMGHSEQASLDSERYGDISANEAQSLKL